MVDGCTGKEVIVDKFKEVYMKIYNRNEAEDEISKFTEKIEMLSTHKDVNLVNLTKLVLSKRQLSS